MDCGTSMVKYILFIFNTLVCIIGILGIVFGVIILNSIGTIEVNGQVGFPPQAAVPIILITIGSIVVFISFLGCCGAIRESVCMTMTYAILLLILLILQMTIVVLLFTHKDKFVDAMGQVIDETWERDQKEGGVFDALQVSFKCCGKTGLSDYNNIFGSIRKAPASCCPNPIEGYCNLSVGTSYPGCRKKFQDFMTGSTETAKYAGIGLIVVELIGFIFACCLANNVRNYKRRNAY